MATAPGRGALAVVRLSGPRATQVARRIGMLATRARVMTRMTIHACDAPDQPIDDALGTFFPAPHSSTGEDVIELSVHGGHQVSAAVLEALVAAGARPALAGEFTERAVRHGKLDLLQAEAVADLIDARSRASHRMALRQLSGALSHRLAALRTALLDAEALIAYEIDFPEEDDGPLPRAHVSHAATQVLTDLDALVATLPAAELGRDGVTIVLAGAPNAGKSSLLNALVGERRAIVSEVPGTTRDAIEVLVDAEPWPLRLVDTAGLRESDDAVERLGVEVSVARLASAHLVLTCGANEAALAQAGAIVGRHSSAPQLLVRTKSDLDINADTGSAGDHELDRDHEPDRDQAAWRRGMVARIHVSAVTGEGLTALRSAIATAVRTLHPEPPEDLPPVTRARHAAALRIAREEVVRFRDAWERGELPAPVAGTHLRAAVHAVDELLGGLDVDEVMARVFRTFCVGK